MDRAVLLTESVLSLLTMDKDDVLTELLLLFLSMDGAVLLTKSVLSLLTMDKDGVLTELLLLFPTMHRA